MEPNDKSDLINEIKDLIAKDDLARALDLLESTFLKNRVIALKGRLKNLLDRNHRGILGPTDFEVTKNKIRDDLLSLVTRLEEEEKGSYKRNKQFYPWIIGGLVLLGLAGIGWLSKNKDASNISFQSLFSADDSTSFNVLIIRFEDYTSDEDTYFIGRSIKEHLNVIQANAPLSLPLNSIYADSIPPPIDVEEARDIQKRHLADLIIYGLAKNVQEGCAGAEVCFRYNIDDQVVAQVDSAIQIKASKHDIDYISTNPISLEKGMLQIDALSMKHWISSLINIKANKPEEAFLELDEIGADTTLSNSERAERFRAIGGTYFELKQYLRAIKAFNQAIALSPGDTIAFYSRGTAYAFSKQYEKALLDFDTAISLNPYYGRAYHNKGTACAFLEQYEQAIQNFTKAIGLDPDYARAYSNRAFSYEKAKQYELAITDYTTVIGLDSDNAKHFYNRGYNYQNLKQYEQAIMDYTSAIELKPDYLMAYKNRGFSYDRLEQYELAVQNFSEAISIDPEDEATYNNRGAGYFMLYEFNKAIRDYNKAIKLNPDKASSYYNRALAYEALKKYKRAIQDYSKTIEFDPDDAIAYRNRGNTYRKDGALKKAKADLQKSLMLDEEDSWTYATLAMIYADEGNLELFYKNLDIAISKTPAYPLKEKLEQEETLQQFKKEPRFLELLNRSAG